jgi:NADPH:quinone reductase-like Zn-dependent oxidoreductase
MKRLQYHRYGGPDVLALEDAETPTPDRGQVLVRVRAAAANAMDWKIRNGEMRAMTGRKFPRGVGHDFAGVIERVGEGVTRLRVGDEVLGAARLQHAGAFAEFVIADEKSVAHKPDGLTFADAATLPVAGITAYQAVTKVGRLRPAVQVATGLGASVTGSCRSGSEADARQLGVDTIVTFDVDPAPLTGRFDVVFDTAGTLPFGAARRMLKPGGKIIDIVPSAAKFVRSILPGPYTAFMGRPDSDDLQHLADAAARGEIATRISRTVPLVDAIPALTELEHGRSSGGGKLVITTD